MATAEGSQRLWVRSLDQVIPRPLAGTDGAQYPFWAPDGRAIGFYAEGKLKRIDVAGGGSQVLADAPTNRGGTWNREGYDPVHADNDERADARRCDRRPGDVRDAGGRRTNIAPVAGVLA